MSSHDHGHDDWFSDGSGETPMQAHTQEVNTAALFKWFVGIAVSLAIVMAVLFAYFDNYTTRLRAGKITRADGTVVPGLEMLMDQEANAAKAAALESIGVRDGKPLADGSFRFTKVEGAQDRIHLPIDVAMDKVVRSYKK
jgi:hypothetical protein